MIKYDVNYLSKNYVNYIMLLLVSIITVATLTSCSSNAASNFAGIEASIETLEIKSGNGLLVNISLFDKDGNPYIKAKGDVLISTTNENVIIDTQTESATNFDEQGQAKKRIILINTSTKDQLVKIIVTYQGENAITENEVNVITPFYERGRIIFPHDPANKNIKLLSKIERSIRLGEEAISNPILLGKDMNNNFIVYLLKPTNLILKITEDGSLSAIINEGDDIDQSPGDVIAGKTDLANNLMYLLKKDDQDNIIVVFMDISGNVIRPYKTIGKLKNIVMEYVKEKDIDKYDFEAVGLEILGGKPVINIREVRKDGHKFAVNRPTMIILNETGDVENLFMINPPLLTSFGMSYWSDTKAESLDYRISISDKFIYLLWGSGYTRDSKIGYMVQKLSKSGKQISLFTRMIREETPPLDDTTLEAENYDKPLEDTYVAKGIYADETGVYVRVQLDGKDYVDIYNNEDVYFERYNVTVEIGESNLIGSSNMVKLPGRIVLASSTGIYIFKST